MDITNVLPAECISHIISLTTPRDACRLPVVSPAFKSAADSDVVWEKFLPSDYKLIISNSVSASFLISSLSKKDLYFHLCHHPTLLSKGTAILSHHESTNIDLFGAEYRFFLFKKKFNKAYASQEEDDCRFDIFKANLRRAARQQKLDPYATYGVTQFSDLTPAEFGTYFGLGRKRRLPEEADHAPILPTNDLPVDFD